MHIAEAETCSCLLAPALKAAGWDLIFVKVDELLAHCDTLETSLERAKMTREQFATSITQALSAPESLLASAVPAGTHSHEAH